jgi:hypothetical protein
MSELRLDHLSHSSLHLFSDCGRAWRARYVDGLATPVTPALLLGSVFDACVERYLRTRALGDHGDLPTLWAEAWSGRAGEHPGVAWNGELPEQVEAQGRRLVTYAGTREALDHIEVSVEDGTPQLQKRLELRVPGVPIPVIGFADVVCADGVPGDIKTSARPWTQERAEREVQPLIYLAALLQMGHTLPRLAFRWWVFVKGHRPQVQVLEVEYRPARLFWVVEYIQAAWRAMEAGAFVPNPGSWRCTPTCPVWGDCVGKGWGR